MNEKHTPQPNRQQKKIPSGALAAAKHTTTGTNPQQNGGTLARWIGSDATNLDVRQANDPRPQLAGEAQGVQEDESRVPEPLQYRGTHARDVQGVERISRWAGREGVRTTEPTQLSELER